jgi:hypothetical protein
MENTNAIQSEISQKVVTDRWLFRLVISLVLNIASQILFPMFMTDGLTLRLAVVCGVPGLWGLYALLFFRTRRERFVGYAAFVPAIVCFAAMVDLLSHYGWAGF